MAITKGSGSFFSSLVFWILFAAFFVAAVWLFFYLRTTVFSPNESTVSAPIVLLPTTSPTAIPTLRATPSPTTTPKVTPKPTPSSTAVAIQTVPTQKKLPTTGPVDVIPEILASSGVVVTIARHQILKARVRRSSREITVL